MANFGRFRSVLSIHFWTCSGADTPARCPRVKVTAGCQHGVRGSEPESEEAMTGGKQPRIMGPGPELQPITIF